MDSDSDCGDGDEAKGQPFSCVKAQDRDHVNRITFHNNTDRKIKLVVTPKPQQVIEFKKVHGGAHVGASVVKVGANGGKEVRYSRKRDAPCKVVVDAGKSETVSCWWNQACWSAYDADRPHMYRMNQAINTEKDTDFGLSSTAAFECRCEPNKCWNCPADVAVVGVALDQLE